jgi:lysophospholipase L1-like esterase
VIVVYCGTNDAGRPDWSLDTTSGWILNVIFYGLSQARQVVVVAPPPVFREYPVTAEVRNQRLADLRERIESFAGILDFEIADIWDAVWQHPDPESLFEDGVHFTGPGRLMSSQVIAEAVQRARED